VTSIYQLKPAFQKSLQPFLRVLIHFKISPNQVTVFALFLSILMATLLYTYNDSSIILLTFPVFLLMRMGLNAIDGMLAKAMNQQSKLGEYLNELCDVLSDTCIFLAFLAIAGISHSAVITITVLAIISEMAGVIAVQIGASRRFDGPMGKSDRAFVFAVIALCLGLGIAPGTWLTITLWICAGLILVTILNRMTKALKESEHATVNAD